MDATTLVALVMGVVWGLGSYAVLQRSVTIEWRSVENDEGEKASC